MPTSTTIRLHEDADLSFAIDAQSSQETYSPCIVMPYPSIDSAPPVFFLSKPGVLP